LIFSIKVINLEFDINKSCNAIHKKINIFTSNLVGVGALYLSESLGYRIFIAIHHLVVDEVSWRIIKEDLEIGYNQLLNKEKKLCIYIRERWRRPSG
jgi:hypothetical protein